ncbi:MAG: flagellar motor switch protein FliM [Deltaproteobacteria bacterium]|nr:flagellar motor switch protein FliM [Deltaproteobacteria bacterium]MCB9488991.1 flagellar motor switch protein FliM [Deltaproteobacteria bacterium]
MNQVLSQSEVDALLEAVSSGEIEDDMLDEAALGSIEGSVAQTPGATHKRGEVRNYDLTSQDRIFRGKMPMLDVIHEKFCRDFRGILSMDLGRIADIEQHESRLIKCQEFLNSLPLPSCLSVFKMSPLPGNGVVVVDSQFVFTIVDIFCGGSGKSAYRVEGRDFSSIELGILKRIVVSAVKEFGKAWRPVFPCDVEFLRTEINPQFVSIAHPNEVVVCLSSTVDVEGVTGRMKIVFPYSTIEPIRERLSNTFVGEKGELDRMWKNEVRNHLCDTSVELKAVMGQIQMSIGDVLNMKVGDVLTTDRFSDAPLDLLVENKVKYKVESGVVRGYKALQVMKKAPQRGR